MSKSVQFGISLTVALGKENRLPGPEREFAGDLYVDLVQKTIETARRLELSIIELVSFPPFDAEVLQPKSEELRNILKDFKVLYHLPAWEVNPIALNKEIREAAIREQQKLVHFAASINVKQLCMHPASFSAMAWVYKWFLKDIQRNAAEGISRVASRAQEYGIPLNIENLPYGSVFFTHPEDFTQYLNKNIGMVLDTAHAFTAGVDPVNFIQVYSDYIKEIHLVDGFNQHEDTHTPVGEGEIDFRNFFNALKKFNFSGPIILEMMSEEDAYKSIEYLRKIDAWEI